MTRRRVVVTGLGCVSPVGNTVAENWANILAGRSGIDAITRFDATAFACRIAGEVRGLDLSPYISAKELRTMDTFIHYGIVAAAQAVTDAGKIGQVNVTGLGLPSEMAGHVKSGASKSFAIWNPIDLGYSATMIAYALATGKATAAPDAEIPMGRMGAVKLDANNEGAMADPFVYDASNIDQFSSIF